MNSIHTCHFNNGKCGFCGAEEPEPPMTIEQRLDRIERKIEWVQSTVIWLYPFVMSVPFFIWLMLRKP